VKQLNKSLSSTGDKLIYLFKFLPLKPFVAFANFNILLNSGGCWRYKLQLEATPPKEDDTITIISPVNKMNSVSFKLTNKMKTPASFTASFTADTPSEFSV